MEITDVKIGQLVRGSGYLNSHMTGRVVEINTTDEVVVVRTRTTTDVEEYIDQIELHPDDRIKRDARSILETIEGRLSGLKKGHDWHVTAREPYISRSGPEAEGARRFHDTEIRALQTAINVLEGLRDFILSTDQECSSCQQFMSRTEDVCRKCGGQTADRIKLEV